MWPPTSASIDVRSENCFYLTHRIWFTCHEPRVSNAIAPKMPVRSRLGGLLIIHSTKWRTWSWISCGGIPPIRHLTIARVAQMTSASWVVLFSVYVFWRAAADTMRRGWQCTSLFHHSECYQQISAAQIGLLPTTLKLKWASRCWVLFIGCVLCDSLASPKERPKP